MNKGGNFMILLCGKTSSGKDTLQEELKDTMMMCGCRKISDINRKCVKICF